MKAVVTVKRTAGEYLAPLDALANLAQYETMARTKLARLASVARLPAQPQVLDLGCSSGGGVIGFQRAGCECMGLEPCEEAIANALALGEKLGVAIPVTRGSGERMPFESESFDVVNAQSAIEHVQNLDVTISEVHRVLRPGGLFWFNAASSMSPAQNEIRGFPLFGWYPNSVKLRILMWAKDHRPGLMGYTQCPAVNWFTPWKARRILYRHGFHKVWDRWDLRGGNEGGLLYRISLAVIRCSRLTKLIADVLVPGCSFAALK